MAATAAAPIREHEKPMSWARAIVIATGFFFVSGLFLGQIPSYVYTVATQSTMQRLEQGFLTLGLLSLGIGLMSLEISLLYDPKPLLPPVLFAAAGFVIALVGAVVLLMVYVGPRDGLLGTGLNGWPQTLPTADQRYFISPIWFQPGSIDVGALGMVGVLTGLGLLSLALLNRWVLSGRAFGPRRDLIVRFCLGLAVVLVALHTTILTFFPQAWHPIINGSRLGTPYASGNIILFLALLFALFALEVWLLPIMVANRQQFMPAVYFHGVVNLIGQVAVPALIAWAAAYPLLYAIHQVDAAQFWVQCSQKKAIPSSCSFSQFTGYIICAIVFTGLFQMLILGIYFWSTRRNTVVLGATYAIIWLGIAVTVLHTQFQADLPAQVPTNLIVAVSIAVLAFIFTWATQREFAPTHAEALGCTGQWLVLGTLLLIFLFGYALFSVPQLFELESGLALFFQPGSGGLHDAFWAFLLMGGLALFQLALITRRRPMGNVRKFAMWSMLGGLALMVVASIIGYKHDLVGALSADGGTGFVNAIEGGHVVFFFGLVFEVLGILACLWGALRSGARTWLLVVAVSAVIGLLAAFIVYTIYSLLPTAYPELVTFCIVLAMVGAFAYTALGPDTPEELDEMAANGNGVYSDGGNGSRGYAVTPRA